MYNFRRTRGVVSQASLTRSMARSRLESHMADLRQYWQAQRTEWWCAVAGAYKGLVVTEFGEVFDSTENYLFACPQDEPADFTNWLAAEFEEFCEFGE